MKFFVIFCLLATLASTSPTDVEVEKADARALRGVAAEENKMVLRYQEEAVDEHEDAEAIRDAAKTRARAFLQYEEGRPTKDKATVDKKEKVAEKDMDIDAAQIDSVAAADKKDAAKTEKEVVAMENDAYALAADAGLSEKATGKKGKKASLAQHKSAVKVASEVEGLLTKAIGSLKQAVHAEADEAKASEATDKAHERRTVARIADAATKAARFASEEGTLANEGQKIVGEMKHTESAVTAALGHSKVAGELEGLLEKAQQYQTNVDTIEDKMSKKTVGAAKHLSALAKGQAAAVSSSHASSTLLMKKSELVGEGMHLDSEVKLVRSAIEKSLNGTKVGAEVSKLLGGAEKAAQDMTSNMRKELSREAKAAPKVTEKASPKAKETKPVAKVAPKVEETKPVAKVASKVEKTKPVAKVAPKVEETKPVAKVAAKVEEKKAVAKVAPKAVANVTKAAANVTKAVVKVAPKVEETKVAPKVVEAKVAAKAVDEKTAPQASVQVVKAKAGADHPPTGEGAELSSKAVAERTRSGDKNCEEAGLRTNEHKWNDCYHSDYVDADKPYKKKKEDEEKSGSANFAAEPRDKSQSTSKSRIAGAAMLAVLVSVLRQ